MTNATTLKIEGMHCGACVRRVTMALNTVPGTQVDSVEIGSATLHGPAEPSQYVAALEKIGFAASAA